MRACVRACVKQVRNTQHIRGLSTVEHGGTSGGEAALPGCSSLAALAPSLGLDSVEVLKTKASFHLLTCLYLPPIAHVVPFLQWPSWWKRASQTP